MKPLTDCQQLVLDFIRHSITDRGIPPTIREIGKWMGIRSTNGVNDHLRALERKGYIVRMGTLSRGIRERRDGDPPATVERCEHCGATL